MAAKLLTDFGSREDASHLVAWERQVSRPGRKPQLSRALVRRVSPTLRIHDLGRTTYEVSGIEFQASAARRKALALPLYLVTRPEQTAAREQVMEALWPNQSPSAAINNLHQTLHSVRRHIAPWLGYDATPDYVPLDSELIYLDPELVQVDSIAFMRQATEALKSADLSRTGPSITRLYTGRFAPEFEYEDWAEDWRTLVHAQFLHLSQATAAALLAGDRVQAAIDVLSRVIELDPLALEPSSLSDSGPSASRRCRCRGRPLSPVRQPHEARAWRKGAAVRSPNLQRAMTTRQGTFGVCGLVLTSTYWAGLSPPPRVASGSAPSRPSAATGHRTCWCPAERGEAGGPERR